MHRTRTSQPYGWDHKTNGSVSHFYGVSHDYDYYPQAWTASDGRHFEEGYYDEKGQHYNNMVMEGASTMLKCSYCGNYRIYKWTEGDLPTCDKCGAQFNIDIRDKEQKTSGGGSNSGLRGVLSGRPSVGMIISIVLVLCIVISLFFSVIVRIAYSGNRTSRQTQNETASVKNSIYVEEIGRTCYLDGEDWYDSETDCWFYYNDTVDPYQWQYWYEGISSDYGDYGWMEYDMGEATWYIETDDGVWVHLPDGYDTSKLWHMTDEFVNAYE